MLILGISYSYVVKIIESNKQNKLVAGILDLELFEGEEVIIENLYPQADQVGLIQEESYDFKLINKTNNDTKYILKLQKIETSDELALTDVVYGLTKDNVSSTSLLSELEENDYIIDKGTIKGNYTINYELRFWLREDIEDDTTTNLKTLKYKLIVAGSQKIANDPSSVEVKLFADTNLGSNCKTYDDGIDTFLVGQCSQNYVWYSGKLWRVVLKNNETGAVKMVTDNAITAIDYNQTNSTTFNNSYVDQWLNQEFLPTLHDVDEYLVKNSGWYVTEESSDTPSRPQGNYVERTVGLLNAYEYYTTYAKSDNLATYSTGYLNNLTKWWLLTFYNESYIYYVDDVGNIKYNVLTNGYGVRPAINLDTKIKIKSGSGEIDNPYILEGDIQEPDNGTTLLSSRYSGEYITFNDELYRIVRIEEGLTKITAVDTPVELTDCVFHDSESKNAIFSSATIKERLETYYQGLDANVQQLIELNTIWYLGTTTNSHYKSTICKNVDDTISTADCPKITDESLIVSTNIGLPRVGEMFTSQITRGTKVTFWTLTPFNDWYVRYIRSGGDMYLNGDTTYIYNARPSMYLKSNVVIASDNTGNGTYEYPYKIELGT